MPGGKRADPLLSVGREGWFLHSLIAGHLATPFVNGRSLFEPPTARSEHRGVLRPDRLWAAAAPRGGQGIATACGTSASERPLTAPGAVAV